MKILYHTSAAFAVISVILAVVASFFFADKALSLLRFCCLSM